jgi:hypothetical protein
MAVGRRIFDPRRRGYAASYMLIYAHLFRVTVISLKIPIRGAATVLILLRLMGALTAFAQSTMEVPAPAPQGQYQPAPAPQHNANPESTPVQILPPWLWPGQPGSQRPAAAPTTPPTSPESAPFKLTSPAAQKHPALPAVFRGCWRGRVNELDWIERLPGAHKVGYWTPKTYRLCYRRLGDDGPFKLTFSDSGVEPNDKIIHPHGRVVPISTEGRAYATLRATLHFDEYSASRYSRSTTFAVDESTKLDCKIVGDMMLVTASVYGERDGEPWFRARWHAKFVQVPN